MCVCVCPTGNKKHYWAFLISNISSSRSTKLQYHHHHHPLNKDLRRPHQSHQKNRWRSSLSCLQ